MWKLIFSDGTEIEEKDVRYWDDIPFDKAINAVIFYLNEAQEKIWGSKRMNFSDFDKVCIAKSAVSSFGGINTDTGYVLTIIRKGSKIYDRYQFKPNSISFESFTIDKLTVPEKVFRQGMGGKNENNLLAKDKPNILVRKLG